MHSNQRQCNYFVNVITSTWDKREYPRELFGTHVCNDSLHGTVHDTVHLRKEFLFLSTPVTLEVYGHIFPVICAIHY